MSVSQIALMPIDPWHIPARDCREAVRRYWQRIADYSGAEIAIDLFDGPQVEMGASSVCRAICPSCAHVFDVQWIFERLDELWNDDKGCFPDLDITPSCCGRRTKIFTWVGFPIAGDEEKPQSQWSPGMQRCIRTMPDQNIIHAIVDISRARAVRGAAALPTNSSLYAVLTTAHRSRAKRKVS